MNWGQLKTILWLRWRLTRNQLFRGSGVAGALTIFLGVMCGVLLLALCAGATFAGHVALRNVKPEVILITWTVVVLVFLLFWTIGLMAELQRSETIDLQRLMHLPMRLGQVFVLNFIASHATLSLFLLLPAMFGLALGLSLGRSPMFLLLLPLIASCVFMITAWTYCLRGWLASMMTNPRRRRNVIMWVTIFFVLIVQGPNLYFNVMRRSFQNPPQNESAEDRAKRRAASDAANSARLRQFEAAQIFIPPLWLPLGAKAAAEGNPLPALLGTLGCAGIGALGLRRAYRSTIRFYHGDTGKKNAASVQAPVEAATKPGTPPARSRLLESKLRGIPEPAVAVAGATLRSMLRAPEVKMALGTSTVVTLILCATFFLRAAPKIPEVAKSFAATGAGVFTLFMLFQFVANQFGLDRDGFRVLVLSPVDRRHLLLGKNLACLPVAMGFGLMMIVGLSVWMAIPTPAVIAAILQLAAMTLLTFMFGNLLSILLPFRIQAGTMKPTKPPFLKMLALVVFQLCFPLVLLPGGLPPLAELLWLSMDGPAFVPVNLILSALLAAVTGVAYWLSLQPLANLYTRREQAILQSVTSESE